MIFYEISYAQNPLVSTCRFIYTVLVWILFSYQMLGAKGQWRYPACIFCERIRAKVNKSRIFSFQNRVIRYMKGHRKQEDAVSCAKEHNYLGRARLTLVLSWRSAVLWKEKCATHPKGKNHLSPKPRLLLILPSSLYHGNVIVAVMKITWVCHLGGWPTWSRDQKCCSKWPKFRCVIGTNKSPPKVVVEEVASGRS